MNSVFILHQRKNKLHGNQSKHFELIFVKDTMYERLNVNQVIQHILQKNWIWFLQPINSSGLTLNKEGSLS